jgi:subfamily B ATP-binding cassette protein MsbA
MSKRKQPKIKRSFWETMKAASGPYRRLFSYVAPYRGRFALGLGFGLLFGVINGCLPLVLARVMTTVFQGIGGPITTTSVFQNRSQLEQGPQMINSLAILCLAIPAVMILRSLCGYLNSYCMAWVGHKVLTDIRTQLFSKILNHSMDFFNRSRSGFLMSRITNDTRMMQMALSTVSGDLFKMPVAILAGVAVLLYLDWKFTIVTLILFPTCIIPISIYGRKARRAAKEENEDMGQMVVTMQETFAGIRVIKSFAREEHQEKIFRHSNKLQFQNAMRISRAMESVGPMVEAIAAVGVGLALMYVYFSQISAAKFLALNMGIFLLYEPIKTLSRIQVIMERSIQAMTEIFRILDTKPAVVDAPDAIDLPPSTGRIELENVSFRYAGGVDDAVKELNLQIEPGKTYALVGASGAGKSTILSLLLRLYDPTSGVIRVDGYDLNKVTQKSLRQQIGLVTQETFLFHDTIFKNIQFGRLEATKEEVEEAARTAFRARFHHGPAARLRDGHRRQRLPPLRWPAAASCDCARVAQERADPVARRSDFRARLGVREADPDRARDPRRGAYCHRDRAPAFHHSIG